MASLSQQQQQQQNVNKCVQLEPYVTRKMTVNNGAQRQIDWHQGVVGNFLPHK